MKTISVRLDADTEAKLRAVCVHTGMSQTEAVKAAIVSLAKQRRPTPGELAEQMGLVGCFASEVGDLGTNHSRYLKEKLRRRHREQSTR